MIEMQEYKITQTGCRRDHITTTPRILMLVNIPVGDLLASKLEFKFDPADGRLNCKFAACSLQCSPALGENQSPDVDGLFINFESDGHVLRLYVSIGHSDRQSV